MAYSDLMNKIRRWDNMVARWFMRHFYFMFFQIFLVGIFLFWFLNIFNVIHSSLFHVADTNMEQVMMSQNINIAILVLLLIVNSFWTLYMFNSIQRMGNLLKDISYHISRLRFRNKN